MEYQRPVVVSLNVEEIVESLGPACALGSAGGRTAGAEMLSPGLGRSGCNVRKGDD